LFTVCKGYLRFAGMQQKWVTSILGKGGCLPFLVPKAEDKTREHFEIRLVKAPEPPVAAPRAEELDESLISGILPENLPKGELWKPNHFLQGQDR